VGGHSVGVAEVNWKPWIFDPNIGACSHVGNSNDFAGDLEDFMYENHGTGKQQIHSLTYSIRQIKTRYQKANVYKPIENTPQGNVVADLYDTAELIVAMQREQDALKELMKEDVLTEPFGLLQPSPFMVQAVNGLPYYDAPRFLLEGLKQRSDRLASLLVEIKRSPPLKDQLKQIRGKAGYSQLTSFQRDVSNLKQRINSDLLRRQERLHQAVDIERDRALRWRGELYKLPEDPAKNALEERISQQIATFQEWMNKLETAQSVEEIDGIHLRLDRWKEDNYAIEVAKLMKRFPVQPDLKGVETADSKRTSADKIDQHYQKMQRLVKRKRRLIDEYQMLLPTVAPAERGTHPLYRAPKRPTTTKATPAMHISLVNPVQATAHNDGAEAVLPTSKESLPRRIFGRIGNIQRLPRTQNPRDEKQKTPDLKASYDMTPLPDIGPNGIYTSKQVLDHLGPNDIEFEVTKGERSTVSLMPTNPPEQKKFTMLNKGKFPLRIDVSSDPALRAAVDNGSVVAKAAKPAQGIPALFEAGRRKHVDSAQPQQANPRRSGK
jgi:hypothetical protein